MSWFSKWFASPTKRTLSEDDDNSKPRGKKAKVLFDKPSSTGNTFKDDRVLTFGAGDGEVLGALASSSLVPRPLALVAALGKQGALSLSPTSYCSLVSEAPTYICIGLSKDAFPEDSHLTPATNIKETKEFTVSIVSDWILEAVNDTTGAYELPAGTTEADLKSGLTTSESEQVTVPRISEAAVSLECKLRFNHPIKDSKGELVSTVVIAEVLCIAVKEGVLAEDSEGSKLVDVKKLRPVAALGSGALGLPSDIYCLAPAVPAPQTPAAELEGQEEAAEAVAFAVADAIQADPQSSKIQAIEVTLNQD